MQLYYTSNWSIRICNMSPSHIYSRDSCGHLSILHINNNNHCSTNRNLGQHSWYSDWLWAGRLRGRSSSPGRVKNFLFSKSFRLILGPTQPPIQWAPGALSPGVKRPGREADHSPLSSAEVKKMCIYTSTPSYDFMA
jgi:hypothetical protein